MEMVFAFGAGLVIALGIFAIVYKVLLKHQKDQFELIASTVLKKSSEEFLTPFDEQLEDYRKFISDVKEADIKERQSVKEQISQMLMAAGQIQKETHQLSQALSSDVKFQGDWGELVLEKVLEKAGLQKDREYFLQNTLELEGKKFRPDVLVKLPQNTHLIIDSKVSLSGYFKYLNENSKEATGEVFKSVKSHIDILADKNYAHLDGLQSPEFVYLFIPVEGVYALILREHPEILDYALKKNIVLVSPVNLLANLKTVNALWRIDKQSKSAVEIAQKAGAMYDKFCLLKDELDKLQNHFHRVENSFQDIHKRLHQGKGNLVDRALELKEHGAKTTRELSH